MPDFFIRCNKCEKKLKKRLKKREATPEEYEEFVLFETSISFSATDEEKLAAMTCPRCNGTDCEQTFYGYNVISYIRGNGYLDKAGCHRDMNMFKLSTVDEHGKTNDPYDEYRQPGEVDDLKDKIKKAGRHNPKKKHYLASVSQNDVRKAVKNPSTE